MIDSDFLREYVTRLSHELLLCQGINGKKQIDYQPKIEFPSWILSEETMSPLFFAYDMRIEELHTVVVNQGSHLDCLTQRVDFLLRENEQLRNKNTELLRAAGGQSHGEIGRKLDKDSNDDMGLLLQQSDLLIKELESVNNALCDRDKKIEALTLEMKDKSLVMSQYETKQKLLQNDIAKADLLRNALKRELSAEKCSVDGLKQKVRDLLTRESRQAAALHVALSERKEYEVEAVECSHQIMTSILSTQDLQEKLLSRSNEINSLSDKKMQLIEALKVSDDKCRVLQQSIIAKDRQLENCNQSMDDLQRDKCSMQLKLQEMMIENEKANTICVALQKEIDRLVHDQNESSNIHNEDIKLIVDTIEKSHYGQGHGDNISALEMQLDILTRDNQKVKETNNKLQMSLERERDKFNNVIKELSSDLKEITLKLVGETQKSERLEGEKQVAECQLGMLQQKYDKTSYFLEEEKGRRLCERDECNRTIKAVEDKMSATKHRMIDQMKELEAEKILLTRKLEETNLLYGDQIFLLESKLEQAEITNADWKKKIEALDAYHRKILMETLSEKKVIIDDLEQRLIEAQNLGKELIDRVSKLMEDCGKLSTDRLQSKKVADEKDRVISSLSSELASSERKLTLITKQLGDNVEDQRERIEREYMLKVEIERLRAKTRVTNMEEYVKMKEYQ